MARWVMKAGLVGLLAVFGTACVSNERFEAASTEVKNQDDVIRKLKDEVGRLERTNAELVSQSELDRLEIERLRRQAASAGDVDALRNELARLRAEMAELGKGGDLTIVNTRRGPAVRLDDSVLFETASHNLSAGGRDVLMQVAERLRSSGKFIRVEGHTDNVPIVRQRGRYPLGNLELSGRRAMEVASFLVEKAGLPRDRVSFAGYGAESPVADNATDEGRSQNRRVDIVLLPDEQ
ncbi:MAG: flagellar motor protein MotB [Planctomycetota bacterium]